MKRKEHKFEKELERREDRFESESKRREQEWEEKLKRKEEQMKEILQLQREDFRKEMEKRDEDLLKKMELIHEAFYNNQFNRDEQLLGIIKEKGYETRRADKGDRQGIQVHLYIYGEGFGEKDGRKR